MLPLPRIPELAQRDRFVRRAVKEGRILTVSDEQSASVPSQKYPGRTVQLFWSSAIEAKRWAEALTGDGDLQEIALSTFAADILPGLAAAKGLAGTDWVSDPIEAEVDPRDLLLRLKIEAMPEFFAALREQRDVFLVAGDQGPLVHAAERKGGCGEAVAIFPGRSGAERHMERLGGRAIIADPMADFVSSTLPWAHVRGLTIAFEPIAGAGLLELAADDVLRRLLDSAATPMQQIDHVA